MKTSEDFSAWMEINSKTLANSSICKYSRAAHTISKEMLEIAIISKSLFDMNLIELDISIAIILKNAEFIKKNSTGNNMYSNALKQFRYFILSTSEKNEQEESIAKSVESDGTISPTEKTAIVKARIGQGRFRDELMDKYENKCIITGITHPKLLIASHIKPWAISNNSGRVDAENGLLLCANFDRLFDSGLITFNAQGKIFVSSFVGKENESKLHLEKNITVDLKATTSLLLNMEYHRDVLFVK